MHRERLENALFRTGYLAILTFMLLPLAVVVVTSFAESGNLAFPPENYSLVHYRAFFEEMRWLSAFDNSLLVASGRRSPRPRSASRPPSVTKSTTAAPDRCSHRWSSSRC